MELKPATLSQIANHTQVSITTASRILAGKKLNHFSEETINKVRQAAKDLRYRPNLLVHGLQKGRTRLVGVVMPAYGGFFSFYLGGIHDTLIQHDYVPVVLWSSKDSLYQKGKSELEQIHALVDRRVDGIILKPVFDAASNQYLHEIFDRRIPLVVVDRELAKIRCNFVGTDNIAGMQSIIDHLHSLGHRRITYFGPQTLVSAGVERLKGFQMATQFHGIHAREVLTPDWDPGSEHARQAIHASPRSSAIVAVNDDFAMALIQEALKAGIRIPQQLSVTGFGNLKSYTHASVTLTTLEQHPYQIGQSATELLLAQINSDIKRQPQRILIPPEIVVRQSTAKARKAASHALTSAATQSPA